MHRGHLDPDEATMPVTREVSRRVLAAAGSFLGFARDRGIPVIHVILTWRPNEAYGFNPRLEAARMILSNVTPQTTALAVGTQHNIIGSRQCELMPPIGPVGGDFIVDTKKTLSIFYGTELEVLLGTYLKDVDTLILMGINTNTCVQCAAFEALNRGFKVIVLEDCVGSMYGEDMHVAALQNIARCLGWVLGSEEVKQKIDERVKGALSA
jgi:nicotinamidase-related amidase